MKNYDYKLDELNRFKHLPQAGNYYTLKKREYNTRLEIGYRMPSFSEIVILAFATGRLKTQEIVSTDFLTSIKKTITESSLRSDTSILCTDEGIYVQDFPSLNDKNVLVMDENILEQQLGTYEDKGVIYSDDRTIRFTPHGFKKYNLNFLDIGKNAGILALVNDPEIVELLSQLVSGMIGGQPPFFTVPAKGIQVIRLNIYNNPHYGNRLDIIANTPLDLANGHTYGIKDN